MRNGIFAVVAAVALGLCSPGAARADEKPVKESEVPKPCLDAVKKKYPAAELKGFSREEEKGKVTYEVEIEVKAGEKTKARKIDVELSPEGKIVCEEETIAKDDLPEKVKKALADSKYGKWDVKRVERIVHDEKDADASYELVVTSGDEKVEVVFDKDGKITKEEIKKKKGEKADKEDDD
jgi:hypothetical protein